MNDRMVLMSERGRVQCMERRVMLAQPAELEPTLRALAAALNLAVDCMDLWGAIPLPVARAILRNMEPALAAVDMSVRAAASAGAAEGTVR